MLRSIEDERDWELAAKRQSRANLLKWVLVAMAVAMVIVLALVATSHGEILPDAPHVALHNQPVETYEPDYRLIVHNGVNPKSSNHETYRIIDWSFVTGHVIYAGATAFDNYQSAKNLGSCAFEGNPDLGRNPSNRDIAVHASVEFGAVVAGDLLIRWYGSRHATDRGSRGNGIPRWLNMTGGNLGSAIGTIKHTHGGMQWVNLCH